MSQFTWVAGVGTVWLNHTELNDLPLISLLGAHGKYASAQANGTLVADRDAIYSWEKFQRINHSDGKVSFRSVAHGKYIVAEADGRMNANRTAIGSWERFEMIYQSSDL